MARRGPGSPAPGPVASCNWPGKCSGELGRSQTGSLMEEEEEEENGGEEEEEKE